MEAHTTLEWLFCFGFFSGFYLLLNLKSLERHPEMCHDPKFEIYFPALGNVFHSLTSNDTFNHTLGFVFVFFLPWSLLMNEKNVKKDK